MAYRKPPFVHIARPPEQQTAAAAQALTSGVIARLRERLSGSASVSGEPHLGVPVDDRWDTKR